MNEYRWADLAIGMREEFAVVVEPASVDAFAALSGDYNPMHVDPDTAREDGFRDRLVHGLLTASYYSTLVGIHLPGRYALLHGLNVEFTLPVYPGDTLTVSGAIVFLSEAIRLAEIDAEIRNAEGSRVSKAKIRVGIRER
ncbi:MAG TPA: MaoC/PaaZ C-terminal domain-containing protein [Thermoanaerobaculia bacterium]|nr:MaoC/PaaZ C-terminal domain-containing protein [Thermoanaerobaculia bacterium]